MLDDQSVALNIYQRALLQSSRLSSYLVSSPRYRSEQVPKLWISFAHSFAKRLFAIKEKLIAKKMIDCPLTLNQIEWLTNEAVFRQLGTLKMKHRKLEMKNFARFLYTSRKLVCSSMRKKYLDYIKKENNYNPNSVTLV